MNKRYFTYFIPGVCLLLLLLTKAATGQGKFAKTADQVAKIHQLVTTVEANPNDMKAHEAYINAMIIADPELVSQYTIWMNKFPKSAVVPFELGKLYEEFHYRKCKDYLLQAVTIDPKFAEAWEYLSSNAIYECDTASAFEYLQNATLAEPKNADYAYKYAALYKDTQPAKYDSLMMEVVYHFPDSNRGAQALCELAEIPYNKNEKTAYYETLYQLYSKLQPSWFKAGMWNYYNYLINVSPDKAFDLALRMVAGDKMNRGYWKQKYIVARQFIEANNLLQNNKPAEAAELIRHIDLGNSKVNGLMIDAEESLSLLKARADDAQNKTLSAYNVLAAYYSRYPSDKLRTAILGYATKLGKDSIRVDADIWRIRDSAAWKVTDFSLESYPNNKPVSLAQYRGKIVLLTSWFPGCGPCRKEFTFFEKIYKKVTDKNMAYVAINVEPREDDAVMPLITKNRYSFVPLRDDLGKPKGNLPDIQGTPTNFLIDQQGRVVFSNFQITADNERLLELMITELLKTGNNRAIAARQTERPQALATQGMDK